MISDQKKPQVRVVLTDINPNVVQAWRSAFADSPEVEIVSGSITNQLVDAWVSPTNSRGRMDGGVDAVIKRHLGAGIQLRVQRAIRAQFGASMPVGSAVCVRSGAAKPQFVISTPTMMRSAEDVSAKLNVAFACAAAFQAIHMQNAAEPGSIGSVALVGMGAATGRVPAQVCANLMWTGYTLFNDYRFTSYDDLRTTIRAQLSDIDRRPENERARIQPPTRH